MNLDFLDNVLSAPGDFLSWLEWLIFSWIWDLLQAGPVVEFIYFGAGGLFSELGHTQRSALAVATCVVFFLIVTFAVSVPVLGLGVHGRPGKVRMVIVGLFAVFTMGYVVYGLPFDASVLVGVSPLLTVEERLVQFALPSALIIALVSAIFVPQVASDSQRPSIFRRWATIPNSVPLSTVGIAAPAIVGVISLVLLLQLWAIWTTSPWQIAWFYGGVALALLPPAAWLVFSRSGQRSWRRRWWLGAEGAFKSIAGNISGLSRIP